MPMTHAQETCTTTSRRAEETCTLYVLSCASFLLLYTRFSPSQLYSAQVFTRIYMTLPYLT